MPEPEPTAVATYDHWVDEHVRFCDTDLVGHVNNVAIAAIVESGRVAFASDVLRTVALSGGVSLRRLEIDYLAELHYPARLRVGSRLLAVGRTSFTVGSGVFEAGRCVATARGVLVLVGPEGATPIPDGARRALQARVGA